MVSEAPVPGSAVGPLFRARLHVSRELGSRRTRRREPFRSCSCSFGPGICPCRRAIPERRKARLDRALRFVLWAEYRCGADAGAGPQLHSLRNRTRPDRRDDCYFRNLGGCGCILATYEVASMAPALRHRDPCLTAVVAIPPLVHWD